MLSNFVFVGKFIILYMIFNFIWKLLLLIKILILLVYKVFKWLLNFLKYLWKGGLFLFCYIVVRRMFFREKRFGGLSLFIVKNIGYSLIFEDEYKFILFVLKIVVKFLFFLRNLFFINFLYFCSFIIFVNMLDLELSFLKVFFLVVWIFF